MFDRATLNRRCSFFLRYELTMEYNTRCAIAACQQLGLTWESIDPEGNFIRVRFGSRWQYFELGRSPFNAEAVACICKDKTRSYQLLQTRVRLPEMRSFLDPCGDKLYRKYLTHDSLPAILAEAESAFSYPYVIKPNKGSLGINVFLCQDRSEAEHALSVIYNKNTLNYDYISIAQKFIASAFEYRLICGFNRPLMVYRRGDGAEFNARYWEHGAGGRAQLETSGELISELYEFIRPVFAELELGLVGFDIIRAKDGDLYLIELNSAPRFDHVIADNGMDCVVDLYCNLFRDAQILEGWPDADSIGQ